MITVKKLFKGNHWAVLASLIIDRKLEKIAEIGVLRGECARAILRSPAVDIIKDYIAIDPWKVLQDTCKGFKYGHYPQAYWDSDYKCVVKYIPWFSQLRVIKLSSLETAPLFMDGYFDLVFIDGDHSYDAVTEDIKAWLPKVRNGGILCGHDYEPMAERKRLWHEYKICEGKISTIPKTTVCKCCGRRDVVLMIHHVNGNHNDNSVGNHMILCRSCHAYHHGKIRGGLNRGSL